MTGKSAIEWTERTWNPIVGCSLKSPGCTHCYAMGEAARQIRCAKGSGRETHYAGTVQASKAGPVWTGKLAQAPDHILLAPLRRRTPTTYFVNSMGDLFHEACPDEWIHRVFAVMALSPQHTFQVLTKRSARMRAYLAPYDSRRADSLGSLVLSLGYKGALESLSWPLPNVWLGVSTERQQEADERIPDLLATPAAIRFISAEPLLGPINVRCTQHGQTRLDTLTGDVQTRRRYPDNGLGDYAPHGNMGARLDWVIAGGESGHRARPVSIQWLRELRDQCSAAGVPFFFKQWGEWAPAGSGRAGDPGKFAFGDYEHDRTVMVQIDSYPRQFTQFGARSTLKWVGKKAAGRLLDGAEHNGMPGRA